MHGTLCEYFLILFDPGQAMAGVYGHRKSTEDRFTGIPRPAGSTDPSLLAFGALAVQPSNRAILDPAPASFGRGNWPAHLQAGRITCRN